MRIQSIHWIPSKSLLLLYFDVFLKSDLWQDINKAILLFFFCQNRHFLGYTCVSIPKWTWILSRWSVHTKLIILIALRHYSCMLYGWSIGWSVFNWCPEYSLSHWLSIYYLAVAAMKCQSILANVLMRVLRSGNLLHFKSKSGDKDQCQLPNIYINLYSSTSDSKYMFYVVKYSSNVLVCLKRTLRVELDC